MNGAFYIGATGLDAEQRALEIVANNITNVNTAGYKRTQARFTALVGSPSGPSSLSPAFAGSAALMLGVSANASSPDFTQGEIQQTGKPLDVAINGDGFIEVLGPGGQTQLWRGGSLMVNPDGYLAVAGGGLQLKQSIQVPADATGVTIGADGTVTAVAGNGAAATTLGKIDIVRPKDMSLVTALPNGLYQVPGESDLIASAPGEDGAGTLVSGAIEGSNVQLANEMVNLMMLQRAYAANAEVVQAGDQLMATANSLKR
jgi:flagellar basal-body rod protein FlgG